MTPAQRDDLMGTLTDIDERFSGSLHVSARSLNGTGAVELNSTAPVATASVIKIPILLTALRHAELGRIDLDRVSSPARDHGVQGSGILRLLRSDLQVTFEDLLVLMIATSDNIATNAVLAEIPGGVDEVNRMMDAVGLRRIRLRNPVDLDLIADDPELLGVAPVNQLRALMDAVQSRTAVSPWVSGRAEQILTTQLYLDQVTKFYKVNPYAAELAALAPLTVASKTGFVPGTRVDAGIVRWRTGGFVYACAAVGSLDESFASDAEPSLALADAGVALLEAFWTGPDIPLVPGAHRHV
ncbi:serine hydrolase [Microbacterium sp. 5K110]|jgi:beta-lactamase class A|uniref:serine hydrolase n=1 Tax=unclassified Microbacterium TaxID=2609290 RepID=UPI0010FEF174|nr:serine hydrolase [Microbacterium sp. 5K110]TLF33617.1 serine hydrolase [Microbacterium sp. 5K110]